MAFISTRATAGLAALGAALVAFAAQAGTLDTVKQRGALVCGVSEGLGGFSDRDAAGAWSGFDVDFCRAVAAAVLGDPQKAQFVPLSTVERFDALRAGKVDVLSRNSTWTLEREAGQGILFAGVDYYDGQAFMVVRHPTVTSALELGGVSVCVQDGTTTRANLADFFKANSMTYYRGHRLRPERGDRQARGRRLRRLHHRPVGALHRAPRPEEAVGGDDPARRDLERAARVQRCAPTTSPGSTSSNGRSPR